MLGDFSVQLQAEILIMKYWKKLDKKTLPWKTEFNRSIFIIKDWVLEEFGIITSLLQWHVTTKIAIIKDKLLLRFEEKITAMKNSLLNSWTWHMILSDNRENTYSELPMKW